MRNTGPASASASRRLGFWVFLAGLVVSQTVSSQLLWVLGVPYDTAGGNPLVKIHLSSYLIVLALVLVYWDRGNPLASLARLAAGLPVVSAFLAMVMAFFAYSILRYGVSGSAFVIDSLIIPAVAIFVLASLDPRDIRRVLIAMIAIGLGNAVIALGEAALGARLVPYTIGGVPVVEHHFRATALMGHPLRNAKATAVVIFIVLAMGWAWWRTGLAVAVLMLALLAFGSRASFGLAFMGLAVWGGWRVLVALKRAEFTYRNVSATVFIGFLGLASFGLVVESAGLGERIIEKLYWDESASVRTDSLRILGLLTTENLLLGVSPDEIAALMARMGLERTYQAIENFWVGLILQMGLVLFIPFTLTLLGFIWRCRANTGLAGALAVIVFLIAASSNNSLAVKSTSLTYLVVIVAALSMLAHPSRRSQPRTLVRHPAASMMKATMP